MSQRTLENASTVMTPLVSKTTMVSVVVVKVLTSRLIRSSGPEWVARRKHGSAAASGGRRRQMEQSPPAVALSFHYSLRAGRRFLSDCNPPHRRRGQIAILYGTFGHYGRVPAIAVPGRR